MKPAHLPFVLIILAALTTSCGENRKNEPYSFTINSAAELKKFFAYSPDRIPFVCAHRGGARKSLPENCIATFNNTLSQVHAMIETDPRYTKDSMIVLFHDATLDRTTNGKGKVADFTLEELRKLRLKDAEGNLTEYLIPTLDEALEWARGRTILVLDRKDVPIEARIRAIEQNNAESFAIVIAYSQEEISKCYSVNPDIIMEIMLADTTAIRKFGETKVPWSNVVAFVSHSITEDPAIFNAIHSKGVMCIAGSSRNYDISYKKGEISGIEELYDKYGMMIRTGADIIEADLAIEAGLSLVRLNENRKSGSKAEFFKGL